MPDDKLPTSGEALELDVTIGDKGFIRRKQPKNDAVVVKMSTMEKQRSKLVKIRWIITQAVKANPEVAALPSYKRVPARDLLLTSKYKGGPGSAESKLLVKHTELIADFVTDIKADSELIIVWINAEKAAAVEAQATDLMVEFGLGGDDYTVYRGATEDVKAGIDLYNSNTSIVGSKVSPADILAARVTRDKTLLTACLTCQYLIPLFMDYGMLPAKYTRRQDFSAIKKDKVKVKEYKQKVLKEYRQSAIDDYKKLKKETPDVAWLFDTWNQKFLANLSSIREKS
jgi:hypothetical protein